MQVGRKCEVPLAAPATKKGSICRGKMPVMTKKQKREQLKRISKNLVIIHWHILCEADKELIHA